MAAIEYSPYELMSIILARQFRDGDVGFAGGATNEIPIAACLLAQRMHAPNLTLMMPPGCVNPGPEALSYYGKDFRYTRGADAPMNFYEIFELSENHKLSFFCYYGMEVDKYGNFNLHFIGDWERPTVRGPGLTNISFSVTAERFYLYPVNHTRRHLVDRVSFISGAGNIDGGDSRRKAGITTRGPELCVTPLAVFDFEDKSGAMRLKSVHQWTTVDEVLANTGFKPIIEGEVALTNPPSEDEMRILREIDKYGLLRR